MCGIAGFIGAGNEGSLRKMISTIVHRGPDEQGFFYNGNVGLGHARLSIIDLSTGQQPMQDIENDIVVVLMVKYITTKNCVSI